jgi:aspartate/methionine/tyrosine aminotransferase
VPENGALFERAAPDNWTKESSMPTGDAPFAATPPSAANTPVPSLPTTSANVHNGHAVVHDRPASQAEPQRPRTHRNGKRHTGAPQRLAPAVSRTNDEARIAATIARLRDEACERARPQVKAGAAPIRIMARMVNELEVALREADVPEARIAESVVNRTIGDVDVRRISAELDGPELVSLADDMGLALPGEVIGGRTATGDTYRWLHERMLDFERQLLARHFDLRIYDLPGTGNPILREMLADHAQRHWGFSLPASRIYLSLGALDGLDKVFRGFMAVQRAAGIAETAVLFPAPSFNVPEWQAKSMGLRLHRVYTRPEDGFKVTPAMLQQALQEAPDIRAFYLTVSNNPTAFAYRPEELRALFDTLLAADHPVYVVADLAYIGTGDPDEDRARMAEFTCPGVLERSILVNSFSKSYTLTGDRCGWVGFGDADLAMQCGPGWANTMASLPAEWQLRYMAYVQLFAERPTIEERIRALYRLRRGRLVRQLQRLNERHGIFATVNLDDGGTVYNWSQLRPGEDVFSLFATTGIAGVPGSGFGYSDDFVRLSVGCIPVPAV